MTKPKRPKYETVSYTPPTPQVFGNAAPSDLPTWKPSSSSSMGVERPRNRPKLQDRLAVYEDDNPRCQQIICAVGVLFPPLWLVGAIMYATTPSSKTVTREAGFKNLVLAIILTVLLLAVGVYKIVGKG
mmetsp:Transcript_41974/g.91036  ORF Transcript_41974/g.91036 Transcript_41974/m.91036 type:complete len:129 (+) Transcript_41974:79-465(+)